jgi:adenylate cyclase
MGDTVNTASRLCQIAAPGQILVSEQTRAALGGAFDLQALPDVEVKGKSRPLTVFHVRGLAGA